MMARWLRRVSVVVVLLQAVLGLLTWPHRAAAATQPEAPPSMKALAERPEAGGGPTLVHVGAYIINVTTIDEQAQTFIGDFYVWFSWLDRRLADPAQRRVRVAPLDQVWHPRLLPVNRRSADMVYPQVVEIDPGGEVRYTQRLLGTFTVPLELRAFPFDRQDLYLQIVAPGYSPDEIAFVVDQDGVGREAHLTLPGWRVSRPTVRSFTKEIANAAPGRSAVQLSGVRVELQVARNWHYYVLREVLPLLFIVLMSFSLFWIPPAQHSMKVGISTAAIFSLMAYYVQLGRALPKVDYLTRMDWFLVGATVLVFASFAQEILGMYLIEKDKMVMVRRMELWSRAVYPVVLLGIVVIAFH